MPAAPPDPLRRLWWKTPLLVRLLPAAALLSATGAGVVSALPSPAPTPSPVPAPHPEAALRAETPVATEPPPTTTTSSTPETTTEEHPTTSSRRSTTRSSTPTTTDRPTTTSTSPPPGTVESRPSFSREPEAGQRCEDSGDIARTPGGAELVCTRGPDGKLRWIQP